jgi:hypothetical protein
MLRKYFLTILILSFSLGLYLFFFKNRNNDVNKIVIEEDISPTLTEINQIDNQIKIKINDYDYNSNWFFIDKINKLVLIPNWEQKRTSNEIITDEKCTNLSSGGFYTKEDKPIGLFVIGDKKYSNFFKNNLFNGIFSKITQNNYAFSKYPPKIETVFSIQSGPIIINDFKYQLLNNLSENRGRRNIILSNINKKLIFITIYNNNSIFDGPRLSDLPEIINLISKTQGWNIANALNLDGGAASSFKNENIYLKELSLVGSFFCIKK